jgi:TolB protein
VEQQLTLERRFIVVYGPDLIGKTSLARRLPTFLASHVHCLYFECKPHRDKALPLALAALAGELARQLMAMGLVSPHQVDTAADSATAVKGLLQQAVATLAARHSSEGVYRLLLVLDDVHAIASLESLFDFLTTLLAEVPFLHLLLTLSDLQYARLAHPAMLGAVTFRLGPLGSDAAQQLITRPAQGALRFDAGVAKRIAELTSNHPYYLHLFCYTLYNCCAREGWINQSDIDRVLETLLTLPNHQFQAIWDQSSRAEQAALTALAGVKGAHGPVTRQEATNYLRRFEAAVAPEVIVAALEALADRGVLVRMGALSYRFGVNLLRYWLDRHIDPAEIVAGMDWGRLSAQLAVRPAPKEAEPGAPPGASVSPARRDPAGRDGRPEPAEAGDERRGWDWGRLSILGLSGTALVGMALLALAFSGVWPVETIEPTPAATLPPVSGGFASPVPSATPTPVPTPTPTRPLVIVHTLPAIAYMAQGVGGGTPPLAWELFVMNADGTNRQQRTVGASPTGNSNADNITPVWSPDGRRLAFVSQRDGNREIYLLASDTLTSTNSTGLMNITQHPAEDWTPAWSPDGQHIAFSSNRQGNWEVFIVNADGTGLRQITSDGNGNLSPVWSPDGRTMAYASKRDGNWEIYTIPAPDALGQVTGQARRLTFTEGNDLSPTYSPQGDHIAFESNREGNVEIYVMDADGSNQRNLSNVPYADEHGPVWSPDGHRLLFYSNRDGNWDVFLMSATGENVINLTRTPDVDEQAPAWRP